MTSVSKPTESPEFVVVRDTVPSDYAGHRAEVIKRKRRQRGPRTTVTRYDFWLRFENGFEGWFSDDELELR